jgi:protein-tyrosine phosphatase
LWTKPFWLNLPSTGRLAVSARPRGNDWLETELSAWRSLGADVVVSLLTVEESEGLGLERESEVCKSAGIEYRSFPIVDRSVPVSAEQLLRLVCEISLSLEAGKDIVIHCRQGIGRAGLVAIAVLLKNGRSLEEATLMVSTARGAPVPETREQTEWLRSFTSAV